MLCTRGRLILWWSCWPWPCISSLISVLIKLGWGWRVVFQGSCSPGSLIGGTRELFSLRLFRSQQMPNLFHLAMFSKIKALAHRYLLACLTLEKQSQAPSAENDLICSLCVVREIPVAPWCVSTMAGWWFMALSAGEMAVQRKTSLVFTPELLNTLTGLTPTWMGYLPRVIFFLNQSDLFFYSWTEMNKNSAYTDTRTVKTWMS